MSEETTYTIEYATSARSKCKKCKEAILKYEIRLQVHSPGQGDFTMTSSYHTACFALPRRLKSEGAEAFVTTYVQDTSEDQSILPDQQEKIIKDIETATNSTGKKTKKDEGEEESFMTRVEATAKAELDGKEPKAKKVKTEQDEEFLKFVELYKIHHKQKMEDLKDFLRWNNSIVGGKKDFILFKVADGQVHGRLGRCPIDGGKLKFTEGDYESIHCNGVFDEQSQVRIPCDFRGSRTDKALRLHPFYTSKPTEEQEEAMKKQVEAEGPMQERSNELGQELIDAVKDRKWELDTQEGMRQAANEILEVIEGKLDLPEDRDNKRAVGQLVMSHNDGKPSEIMEAIIKKFGFKEVKKDIEEKKKQTAAQTCANQKNAGLVMAFKELSDLYYKTGNANAGGAYKKAMSTLMTLKQEVTASNAMSFSRGKTKLPNIGKGSAEKMQEFCETGTIEKLEEKRRLVA